MKDIYIKPAIEVITFEAEDILTVSSKLPDSFESGGIVVGSDSENVDYWSYGNSNIGVPNN